MAEGFQAHLVASEEQDVVNPIQIAWDGAGRLYVACSPSYPQSLASVRPSDYILVLEDEMETAWPTNIGALLRG